MRLVGVHVEKESDHLAATWSFEGGVSARESVLWSVFLSNPDGALRQLGYKLVDGQFSAQFMFDFGPGRQQNFPDDVDRSEATITARYPLSVLDGLGEEWTSRATLNVDGRDVSELS